jgi:flagellar motor switch/type III secretory pathway protein FliN
MEAATKTAPEPQTTAATAAAQGEAEKKDPVEQYGWLPCEVSLEVPIAKFTVDDLLRLAKGTILETTYHSTSDIPLRANGLLIGWTEFEVVGNRLAARITELA